MGANESRQNREGLKDPGNVKTCYYDVLGIEQTANEDEIKRAYRRQALKWHPDKNADQIEEATFRFTLIQEAFETLSDVQERAWYDAHREEILRGDDKDDEGDMEEETGNTFSKGRYGGAGITNEQLMKFFDIGSYSMEDSVGGFFTVYRNLFERLDVEESRAAQYDSQAVSNYHNSLPSFGNSKTGYDKEIGSDCVRTFYAAWGGFSSGKSFAWKDAYRLRDAPDRRVKRLMEKENRKARDSARREYNETVRSLVQFLRKRDPRVRTYMETRANVGDMTKTAQERAKEQSRRDRLAHQRAALENYTEQAWMTVSVPDEEGDNEGEGKQGENEEENEEFECVACDKVFRSERQWNNHEQSKKHLIKVEQLKKEMMIEEEEFEAWSEENEENEEEDYDEKLDREEDYDEKLDTEEEVDSNVIEIEDNNIQQDELIDELNDTSDKNVEEIVKEFDEKDDHSPDQFPSLLTRSQQKKKRRKQDKMPNWGTSIHFERDDQEISKPDQRPPKKKVREKKSNISSLSPNNAKNSNKKSGKKVEEKPRVSQISDLTGKLDKIHISGENQDIKISKSNTTIPSLEELEALFSDDEDGEIKQKQDSVINSSVSKTTNENINTSEVIDENIIINAPENNRSQKSQVTTSSKTSRKERKKKMNVNITSGIEKCHVCGTPFPSRNQLFKHVQATGHASATTSKKGKMR